MRNSSGRACKALLMSESGSLSSASASADFSPRRGVRGGPGKLPVLDLLGTGPLRFTLPFAIGVDEGVGEDPEQPRLQVRARLELVERGVGLGKGLLHQVLGVGRVAGHPHPGRVQLIQVRQHLALEPLAPLLECLRYRGHLLRYGTHLLGCLLSPPGQRCHWAGEYMPPGRTDRGQPPEHDHPRVRYWLISTPGATGGSLFIRHASGEPPEPHSGRTTRPVR